MGDLGVSFGCRCRSVHQPIHIKFNRALQSQGRSWEKTSVDYRNDTGIKLVGSINLLYGD